MIVDDVDVETVLHTAARAKELRLSQRYNMQRSFWCWCLVDFVWLSQVLSCDDCFAIF